jgi:hypothetical protein
MELAKNVGENDRKIRIIAGVVLVLWGILSANWLGAIGLVLILTGYYRTCPAYSVLQMDTLEKK